MWDKNFHFTGSDFLQKSGGADRREKQTTPPVLTTYLSVGNGNNIVSLMFFFQFKKIGCL